MFDPKAFTEVVLRDALRRAAQVAAVVSLFLLVVCVAWVILLS